MIALPSNKDARSQSDTTCQVSGRVLAQSKGAQGHCLPFGESESYPRVLMQVKGLRKAFGGQVVLDEVYLTLREGEIVLLRGENGSGKTTLLNILTGNMEPDAGDINLYVNSHPEHFHFPRRWWQELNPWDHFTPERVANEGVGRTWQDIRLFGSQSLLENLRVAPPKQAGEKPWRVLAQWHRWHSEEVQNRVGSVDLLQDLGLKQREDSSADMISLGQCKRVAVARATRANAKILFLDEPLAGLDETGVADVLSLLRHLAKEHRLTVVIVEHVFNIPLVLDIATVVWTLTDGKIQQETVAEAKADPSVQNTSALSALIREMASPAAVVTEESLPRGATLTRVFRPGVPREPLLTIKGLVAHRGHRLVVGNAQEPNRQGFDLTVHKGELVLLHAPNGWGKTSLMEVLSGILPCQEGSIHLDGANLEHKAAWERHADGLSVIPARDTGFCNLTISEFQRITRGVQPASDFSANCTTRGRLMSSLSGGERKRLALQTATRNSGKVRIWDEPFTSLDATAATSLCNNLFPDAVSASLVLIPSSHASPYF